MIQHSMIVTKNTSQYLNPGQVLAIVNAMDQLLYALAKQIQPKLGEESFVVRLGGLHVVMATLNTLSKWFLKKWLV